MTMTPERLAELDAVVAKATDGNWGWCAAGARLYASPKGAMYSANVLLVHDPKWQANETDRAAIVALHNVYPDLRAHIDAQAATIARLRGALEPFAKEAACWDEEQNDGFSFPDHEPLEMESQLQVKHLRCARATLTGAASE